MNHRTVVRAVALTGVLCWVCAAVPDTASAASERPQVVERADGTIGADGLVFASWNEYANSQFFRDHGLRCGTRFQPPPGGVAGASSSDCSFNLTNPSDDYSPAVVKYRIPVVVHVIRDDLGTTGYISPSRVRSQIDILNEDFQALPGTNGENGTDVQIEFYLAEVDPFGNPTDGITYSNNTAWFNDTGLYWNTLAWNTYRYLNIYTNLASGNLGYVPNLPQGGIAGRKEDRVVVLWSAFGRNAPIGAPYDQGRTATHEVGHYLGLLHTFQSGCASASSCASNGDLICDTNPESAPVFGCPVVSSSCGSPDPFDNYMDYSDDLCLERFTFEQARRMRCSLQYFRRSLFETVVCETGPGQECGPKSRYLSFQPPPEAYGGAEIGIRVTVVNASGFPDATGRTYWVGPPGVFPEDPLNGSFNGAMLQCDPYAGTWVLGSVIHVTGPAVVPGSSYELQAATADCIASGEESCFSAVATIDTGVWGDVVVPFGGDGQPNFQDISAIVEKFKALSTAPIKAEAQLQPDMPNPNANISFSDIAACVNAFKHLPYPFGGPPVCP